MKIKRIQIQNLHNNGKAYEVGVGEMTIVLDGNKYVEISSMLVTRIEMSGTTYPHFKVYATIEGKETLIEELHNCPVIVEYF